MNHMDNYFLLSGNKSLTGIIVNEYANCGQLSKTYTGKYM